ncbi:MAG: sugar ABC transporter permease [Nitrososphaeria archaeon]
MKKFSFRSKMLLLSVLPLIYAYGLVIYPFASLIYYSFFDYDIGSMPMFNAGANYVVLFMDPLFYKSLQLTLSYAILSVGLEFLLGIMIAYILIHILRGRSIALSILILPLVITPAVTGIIWRILFDTAFGHVNFYLSLLGLPQINWLTRPTEAFFATVIVDVWQWTPFIALVAYAGLSALPVELVESAYIDGASELRTFKDILLPRIRALLYIILFLRIVDALKIFDTVYTMTGGGPGTSTNYLVLFNYLNVMTFYHIGYGCTIAVFIILLMNLVVLLLLRRAGPLFFEV